MIRSYRPTDRTDVYEVCRRTADAGNDATGNYTDDDLMPDIFAGPYLEFEPELALVVDTGQRVSGYVLATSDTRAFVEWYRLQWLPRLSRFEHVSPPLTPEDAIVDLGYRPERMLIPEVDDFPAHLHIDLLPELQGQGLGRELLRTLLSALRERGIRGLHLGMDPANRSARAFYDRLGFRELPSSTPTELVLGIAI
ncbi:GNAT family N-acetyltransferase [Homoserinimonas sp. A447]